MKKAIFLLAALLLFTCLAGCGQPAASAPGAPAGASSAARPPALSAPGESPLPNPPNNSSLPEPTAQESALKEFDPYFFSTNFSAATTEEELLAQLPNAEKVDVTLLNGSTHLVSEGWRYGEWEGILLVQYCVLPQDGKSLMTISFWYFDGSCDDFDALLETARADLAQPPLADVADGNAVTEALSFPLRGIYLKDSGGDLPYSELPGSSMVSDGILYTFEEFIRGGGSLSLFYVGSEQVQAYWQDVLAAGAAGSLQGKELVTGMGIEIDFDWGIV